MSAEMLQYWPKISVNTAITYTRKSRIKTCKGRIITKRNFRHYSVKRFMSDPIKFSYIKNLLHLETMIYPNFGLVSSLQNSQN